MSSHFHFFLTRHIVDGVKLALRNMTDATGSQLVIPVSNDPACALSFGKKVPEDFPGMPGLMRYQPRDLEVDVEDNGFRAPVIFPGGHSNGDSRNAELIDRLRYSLRHSGTVIFIVHFDRIVEDLPPLRPTDSLSCFWELRDHLTEQDLDSFSRIAARRQAGDFSFRGLRFYLRSCYPDFSPEEYATYRKKLRELQEKCGSLAAEQGDDLPEV